jgi:hypothetical protein
MIVFIKLHVKQGLHCTPQNKTRLTVLSLASYVSCRLVLVRGGHHTWHCVMVKRINSHTRRLSISFLDSPVVTAMQLNIKCVQHTRFSLRVGGDSEYDSLLEQGWANYGPRVKYGPLRGSMRPAEGLENAKKMRFRKKHLCEHNKTLKNEGGIMERERRDENHVNARASHSASQHFLPDLHLFRNPSSTCLRLRFIIVY